MHKKLKILVSAYACSPNHGSEPGMGWNFVFGLSKVHEIHVITEKIKWKSEVEKFLFENPHLNKNLHFYFIEKQRKKILRKLWPPSYYWLYKKWQKQAYQLALNLDDKENFDLIHQLNMVGFREPGYLWRMNKPFVWGPIGGLENSPWRFLSSLGLRGFVFYLGRNIFNIIQRNFLLRARKAATRPNSVLIAATPGNQKWIKDLWNVDAQLICEVGQEINQSLFETARRTKVDYSLKIIWSGQHTPRKNLSLLLFAMKGIDFPYELHILGSGTETKKWQNLAVKFRLNKNCHWHGWLEREKAIEIMQTGHVLCITSISDLTSTVTLEALSYGLPIICLDHCGFSYVVTEECGIKIPVDSPINASKKIANSLHLLYENESFRQKLSSGAIKRAGEFSWDKKIAQLDSIYYSVAKK